MAWRSISTFESATEHSQIECFCLSLASSNLIDCLSVWLFSCPREKAATISQKRRAWIRRLTACRVLPLTIELIDELRRPSDPLALHDLEWHRCEERRSHCHGFAPFLVVIIRMRPLVPARLWFPAVVYFFWAQAQV